MKKMKLATLSIVAVLGMLVVIPSGVYAAGNGSPSSQIQTGVNDISSGGKQPTLGEFIRNIVNILLYILGAIAVVMIVIGGIRYTTSNGDSSSITSAKNTILYSIIGLIVAILAFAIVNFVITNFTGAK